MPFKLNRNKKKDHADPPVVEAEVITQQDVGTVEEIVDQSVADPTAEPTLESESENVASGSAEASDSVTPQEVIEEQIVGGGDEFIQETPKVERFFVETCEPAVVGPPEAVAAAALENMAAKPGTAVAVVKQEEKEVVVKKPIISARMLKTWGRSVKDNERKANLLLPGVHPDFAGDLVITVLSAVNPKLPGKGPWFRFAKYRTGMTVAEYVKACERVSPSVKVSHADLKWDVNHGYIRVEAAAAAEAAAPKAEEEAA